MKLILIDPVARTIEPVDFSGDWKEIARLLNIGDRPFSTVTSRVTAGTHDPADGFVEAVVTLYIDDEGLFQPNQTYFHWLPYEAQPLAGRALVTSTDSEGETIEPELPIEIVRELVKWDDEGIVFDRLDQVVEEDVVMPHGLGRGTKITNTPKFGKARRH